ncbi:ankyrin repeat-containing domain protein [Lactifluus subvellereus]|nr:ankyrin repeat-containing domain protein [Lactifluus subvellereus]
MPVAVLYTRQCTLNATTIYPALVSSQPTDSRLSDHIPSTRDMSASSQISVLQSLLGDAVEKYKNQVGKSLIEDQLAILRTCDSVESVAALLEERAQAFREFLGQDRHGNIMKSIMRVVHVLHATFNPVSGLGAVQVGHGIVSIPFSPVKIIFAAIGILLATVKDVSRSYDALLDLFESLGNFVQRLDIYTKMRPTMVMTETIVKTIVELLSTLALATKQIKQGRLKKFGMKLLGENEVEAALKRLDRLTQDEARAIAAQTLELVYGLVQNMNVPVDDRKASTDGVRKVLETSQQITSEANKTKHQLLPNPAIADLALLERGADANARANENSTLLHWASEFGHPEVAQVLLGRGADVNARAHLGQTPLYVASVKGYLKTAQVLLDHGADANARANNNWTPLHVASEGGHLEVAQVLLGRGAEINARAHLGQTPLYVASVKGHLKIAQVLLDRGADAKPGPTIP